VLSLPPAFVLSQDQTLMFDLKNSLATIFRLDKDLHCLCVMVSRYTDNQSRQVM
jgi:hypothetical protein